MLFNHFSLFFCFSTRLFVFLSFDFRYQLYHVECVSSFKQGVKDNKFADYDEKDYRYFMGCDDYVAGLLSREGLDKGRHNGFL